MAIIGTRVARVDGYERVSGKALYTADWKQPRMLYAEVVSSTRPHAEVVSVDTSEALRVPGVEAIVDCKETGITWSEGEPARSRMLLDEHIRFVGEIVAAVAAKTRYAAHEAAEKVRVVYNDLPAVYDPEEALKKEAPQIWTSGNLRQIQRYERGFVEKGFQEADLIFEDTFRTSRFHNAAMETGASLAWWTGGNLTVIASTQSVTGARAGLAKDLQIPLSKVRVIALYKGGGFGNRSNAVNHDLLAAILAKKTGKPVLLEFSRYDEFLGSHGRWPTVQHYRIGVKKDGEVTALQLRAYADMGAYHRRSPEIPYIRGPPEFYRCPNMKLEVYAAYTNTPFTGSMRAPPAVAGCFGSESLMDHVANQMKIDPVEFRLKNHIIKADNKDEYTSNGITECIRKGAEIIDWKRVWHPPSQGPTYGSLNHGVGMAIGGWMARLVSASAIMKVNRDGSAHLVVGVTDIGGGAKTVLSMIAADTLGIPLQDVKVTWGDTDVCPFAPGETGSRTTTNVGLAVKVAAEDAKSQLLAKASQMLDVDPHGLDVADGTIFRRDEPATRIPLSKVAETMPDAIIGKATTDPKLPSGKARFSFAAHFAEVLVDKEVGKIIVKRYVAVHDSGRIVNPLTAENQVQGGVTMGLGLALTEEQIVNKSTGYLENPSLWTYRLPMHLDVPKIEVHFVETDDPYGPKSLGEPPVVPVCAAIANAVYNAVGARVKEIPLTPERVLRAMNTTQTIPSDVNRRHS
ncbi:MAG: molybdopterin-dependent oxidoreductase [Thaumarchaeota archaeon]|nr:molybdopterin-dependent oxidoreductase [Nitrososphaerota archaeon]